MICDCILLDGTCDVNESLITGESDSIGKKPGDLLLSGSFVVNGRCRAKAEHVGADNYVAVISNEARKHKKAKSEIMNALQRIILVVSIAIIPIGAALFYNQYNLDGNTLQHAVVFTTAALIGMIPEGLVLLTSSVLAISVIRLSKHKVMVQELTCIEALARVDVLCLDKTGTITEGSMELSEVRRFVGLRRRTWRRRYPPVRRDGGRHSHFSIHFQAVQWCEFAKGYTSGPLFFGEKVVRAPPLGKRAAMCWGRRKWCFLHLET